MNMLSRFTVLPLLVAVLFLSGCASSRYGEQVTTVHYYPSCYAPINDLRAADKEFNTAVISGGVIGALSGALVGYMATGRAEGAAVGAAAGAIVGTGVGYAKAKQDRITDDNRRMSSYLVDIDGDISGLDRTTAAARVARDCYAKEFKQAITGFKNGVIAREELNRRYAEIKDGCSEAEKILGVAIADSGEKEQQYRAAIADEAKLAKRPVPAVIVAEKAEKPKKSTGSKARGQQPRKKSDPAPAPVASKKTEPETSQTKTVSATISKTPAPQKGNTSLDAVAQNTQRLNESKRDAESEQTLLREMQAEMDGTFATLTS